MVFLKRETLVSEKQLICKLWSLTFSTFLTAGENPLSKSSLSSMKRGEVPHDNRAVVTENSSEALAGVGGNENDHKSPENKRHV